MYPAGFKGAARRLVAIDIALVARSIGVGEDEVRAVIEVETAGGGFDKEGRPRMLFEPHVFYRELSDGSKRRAAQSSGIAYVKWGMASYPVDSYPRLALAMKIDPTAALRSCSWGLGQVMGFNHKAAGYASVGDMVTDFCDREAAGLEGMIRFIESEGLDDDLQRHDWSSFARGYNGAGYAKHGYHTRLAKAFDRWQQVPDVLLNPLKALPPRVGMGSRGVEVKRAQRLLSELGYDPGPIDGWFGDLTHRAAYAFQLDIGIKMDAIVGPITWAELIHRAANLSAPAAV